MPSHDAHAFSARHPTELFKLTSFTHFRHNFGILTGTMGRPNDLRASSEADSSTASLSKKRTSDSDGPLVSKRSRTKNTTHPSSAYTDDDGSAADALEYLFLLDSEHRLFEKNLKIFTECLGPNVGKRYSVGTAIQYMTDQISRKAHETGNMGKAKYIHKRMREEWFATVLTLLAGDVEDADELKPCYQCYQINGNKEKYLMKINILPVTSVEDDDNPDDGRQDEPVDEPGDEPEPSTHEDRSQENQRSLEVRIKSESVGAEHGANEGVNSLHMIVKEENVVREDSVQDDINMSDSDAVAAAAANEYALTGLLKPSFTQICDQDWIHRHLVIDNPRQALLIDCPADLLRNRTGRPLGMNRIKGGSKKPSLLSPLGWVFRASSATAGCHGSHSTAVRRCAIVLWAVK
jgi:hypothetical protein